MKDVAMSIESGLRILVFSTGKRLQPGGRFLYNPLLANDLKTAKVELSGQSASPRAHEPRSGQAPR
jgi:hypothetical protein